MNDRPKRTPNRQLQIVGSQAKRVLAVIGKVFGTFILIGMTTTAILACIFAVYVNKYIDPTLDFELDEFELDQTSFIMYLDKETGEYKELEALHGTQNRVWVSYEEIPEALWQAAVAIEDHRFFEHKGVDWKRTIGAFGNMFLSMRDNFGGSTITQQLIKNLTDDKEVTVKRKILEIFRALEFENKYTKEQILEYYLNTIYLGEGCNGVKTAAEIYFAKDISELTVAECAAIIGITNAPTLYNPYINPDKNKERQEIILKRMYDLGYIETKAEYEAAVNQPLVFKRSEIARTSSHSYFVDQVIEDVRADLIKKLNISGQMADRMIYSGGLTIYATIDMDIQNVMDEVFENEENYPVVKANGPELPEVAMTIIDPYTGDVVGIVGGRGEKTGKRTLNRASQSYRQPGSAIKPVSVYAPALDSGAITPYSIFDDAPFRLEGGKPWPVNQNRRYTGRMTVMRAVELSNNCVAARVVDMITPERAFNFANVNLGLSSLVKERKVGDRVYSDVNISPMALGGLTKGVSVTELTAAYAAFANEGDYIKPRTYSKVEDAKKNVLLDNSPKMVNAMKKETAYYMNLLLQSVVQRGTGTSAKIKNMPVAGKTGTTDRDYDRWFVGYTPYYCAAVWFGFDEPQEIRLEKSRNPALTMWHKVMEKVHENLEKKDFFQMETISASYCMDSGMQPGPYCRIDVRGSRVATGVFFKDNVPQMTCTMHVPVKYDKVTNHLATPFCPEENLIDVSLLDLTRAMPAAGIALPDEQYTLRHYGVEPTQPQSGFFRPVGGGANDFCDVHTTEQPEVPENPEDPTDPDWPWDPSPPPTDPGSPTIPPVDPEPPVTGPPSGGEMDLFNRMNIP